VLLSTCPEAATAHRIGRTLADASLVACVNIVPGLRSIYRWSDTVQDEAEILMIMKTTGSCLAAARETLLSLHPYDVPAPVALPIADGHDAYLRWVSTSTRAPQA
jgi:periplasmic divalent cation tolerance protein